MAPSPPPRPRLGEDDAGPRHCFLSTLHHTDMPLRGRHTPHEVCSHVPKPLPRRDRGTREQTAAHTTNTHTRNAA